jgi:rhamnosyltransferase
MNQDIKARHIFIVGCKGIPTRYGGFETFVDKLTEYRKDQNIQYHVAGIKRKNEYDSDNAEYEYNGAHCFDIKERISGPAKAIFYDIDAIKYSIEYIKKHNIEEPIIYVLACRIGPFIRPLKKKIHKLGGKLYVNPDGHEWKRAKWSAPIRKYWKISERLMVKHADLLICDSKGIEAYIKEDYKKYNPNTTFIAYGAETSESTLKDNDEKVVQWYKQFNIQPKNYYLIVGRFVPENNFERMIKEFMRSKTKKDLVIITNYDNVPLYDELIKETHFDRDKRIKFVGTVYDQPLLKKIREDAYGYLHGHSVGGTNPSLLEALGQTDLNLLFDVSFNREVGEDGALYWTHEYGLLSNLIAQADSMSKQEIAALGNRAKERINQYYSWEYIRDRYEELFNAMRDKTLIGNRKD